MKYIPSTAEILAFKMLGKSVDKRWINWAYDMLNAGFETESLVMLAGEIEPYNQFELQSLTNKVFNELNLTWDDIEQVYTNYICYLVSEAIANKLKLEEVLNTIKEIYYQLDYEPSLQDFYMLYCAYDDLKYSDNQYYWEGANRGNIDLIVRQYFEDWIKNKCRL
jgi:hypothetical protein